ncbi:MAG: hypothetical protein AAGE52_01785 [Myxococcota bacterium]
MRTLFISWCFIFCVACGDDSRPGGLPDASLDGPPDTAIPPGLDPDGDGLSNDIEGVETERDTDGDGTPDYLDTDSDNDDIPDSVEAGPADMRPIDSDDDGIPDYLDEDSDNNGIPDRTDAFDPEEGPEGGILDTDGDGEPDYRDDDDDGDFISDIDEIDGRPGVPRDSDDDGIPNFRDVDSDGDTISDRDEGGVDTDDDGVPNYLDDDSDNDTLPDILEAGDIDLDTPPVDTDEDFIADFVDLDSDSDGLSDAFENENGSSPTDPDTDDDGVTDLIEVGGGTDLNDPADNPRTRGDFVFVVPFREPAMPPRDTLQFRTNIRRADIYFLFDLTGSMIGEITAMRDAVVGVLDEITCDVRDAPCLADPMCADGEICGLDGFCIEDPEVSGCIANVGTGAGFYAGYGSSYRNLLSIQGDPEATRDAIPSRADGPGADESLFESAACVADSTVCFGALCSRTGVGCPGYRRDAVRVLAMITDEPNQCPDDPSDVDYCPLVNTALGAGSRLRLSRINMIGIDADASNSPREDLQSLAVAAGSVNERGEPFYYEGDGARVVDAITEGIQEISSQLELFVNIEASDVPGDAGDALQFVQRLVINESEPECAMDESTTDADGDGFQDSFVGLRTGTTACWDVIVRDNTRVRATAEPLVFEAALTVFGDGSPLDRRRVFFLVPPVIEGPIVD